MRTTPLAVAVVVAVVLGLATASATEVYWTPAPELAPQGSWGSIASCDLDADGDCDVSRVGACKHFWNVGTPQVPAWQLVSGVVPGLAGCSYRTGTYGDLDGDGDFDLVIGCFEPYLHMFWNVGTPQVPQWQYDPSMFGGAANYTVPCLADLDADGDLDLVMVTCCGAAFFWENIGTPQIPIWATTAPIIPPVFLTPPAYFALGDLDNDGDLDIVGFTPDTPLQCWENVGTPQACSFVENPGMLTGVAHTRGYGLALPDVDSDGDCDLLVVGPDGATISLYLNESVSPVRPISWSTIKAMYR
jgi:hypothetical protein